MLFLVVLCILSLLIYSSVEYFLFIKYKKINSLLIVTGMFDVVYAIFPLILIYDYISKKNTIYIDRFGLFSSSGVMALGTHYIYALIGFFMLLIGYYSTKITFHKKEYATVNLKKQQEIAWFSLIIGAVSLFLWSYAYGSIFDLIIQANAVRSGQGSVVNSMAFFKHPSTILLMTSYMFYSLWKINSSYKKNLIGLATSILLSGLYLLANDGRLSIVLYIIGFLFLSRLNKKTKKPLISFFIFPLLSIICFYLLSYMDAITYFLRYGVWNDFLNKNDILDALIRELLFLPLSGQHSMMYNWDGISEYTILDDIITGIFAWLPYSMKPDGFMDVWNLNTIQIFGDISVRHGQYPCSLIAQSTYDFGLLGVVVICFVLGKIISLVDANFYITYSPLGMAIYTKILIMSIRGVAYFSFYDISMGMFSIFLLLIIYKINNLKIIYN